MNIIRNMEIARLQREKEAKEQIASALKNALPWLEQAQCLMNSNRLDKSHSELYTAICDAVTAAQEAGASINDAPDIYDVATHQGQSSPTPIGV